MPVQTPAAPEPVVSTLKVSDRCDQCGAQAYAWVLLESGELLFCAHHWTKYQEPLREKAIRIIDETYRLYNT